MPYIDVKIAKAASRKQERVLTEKLGQAISLIPGKTERGLMINISSDEHLYKGGEFLEYGAFINVVLKSGAERSDCEKLNAEIFNIMENDLKIPAENIYTTFTYCDDFGVKGKFI